VRQQALTIQDLVPEGTIVRRGDYVAQIERTQQENNLRDARERLQREKDALERAILDTAVNLSNERDRLTNQKHTVEEAQITLDQSQYEPPATIRKAQLNLERQQRSYEQMLRSYERNVVMRNTNIMRAESRVEMAEMDIEDIEYYLSQFRVTAPSDGMVTYISRRGVKRRTGSAITPQDLVVAALPDLSSMISKVYISEIEIRHIEKDQKVQIRIDALPDRTFRGTVISIANIGEQLPGSDAKMFEVLIRIDDNDPSVLRPSMTTSNKIIIDTFYDVISIPTECIYAGADNIPYVYLKNGKRQIVVLGRTNERNTIIEKGLKDGVQVYISPPENG
jgi:multidrug resistance efflux pump